MPPQGFEGMVPEDGEQAHLLGRTSKALVTPTQRCNLRTTAKILMGCVLVVLLLSMFHKGQQNYQPTGPYKVVEVQTGKNFFDFYDFYDGADSIGSAGYNTYVSKKRADELGLIEYLVDKESGKESVYMDTFATADGGFRESIRLEGKRRFDRGLFILDVEHMPTGCGVWPAYWLTDEDTWPDNGEIDILEGINTQAVAKTALHTSDKCSMYAQVPSYAMTGTFDSATGIPDTFTGKLNTFNRVEADNCWVMAPHQWANQGCIIVDSAAGGSIGAPMNDVGGGVYALEWDPANGYIKSWVFQRDSIPENLQASLDTASSSGGEVPDPDSWPLPYAYFAIGDKSGCSADHFKNMRLVINTAFCGAVAGNKFAKDCPAENKKFNIDGDSVLTCNAFIEDQKDHLSEAYWKIRGSYVFEREMEFKGPEEEEQPENEQKEDQN